MYLKISTILQNPVAEAHGHDSQTARQLYCAEIGNVFPMARVFWKVRYSTLFIAVLRTESVCTKHRVHLFMERQLWQGKCTVIIIVTPLYNCSVKPNASS